MNICLLLFSLASLLLAQQKADIVFAGDAMMHQSQIDDARRSDGTYDFSDYFRDVKGYVDSADYAVVNLETPLSAKPYSGYPCFNAPQEYADALTETGFDLFMLANNHMLDRSDKGLVNTLTTLEGKDISHTGAYRNKAERDTLSPFFAIINGIKVAFLNYTFSTNGIMPKGDVIVNPLDRKLIKDDVEKARDNGAELIAVMPHWGIEYVSLPPSHVKSMAEYMSSLGVDMIIGGHPHVIQPMEIRKNPVDTTRRQVLVYSMGNFISGMRTIPTRGGAMVKVSVSRDSIGRAVVDSCSYRLVYTVPPATDPSRPHYHLVYPTGGAPDQRARSFSREAHQVFDRYNRNVSSR